MTSTDLACRRKLGTLSAFLLASVATPALAQQTNPLPSAPEIRPTPVSPVPPQSQTTINSNAAVPTADCPLTRYPDLDVTINSVDFTGPKGAALDPEIKRLVEQAAPAPAGVQKVPVVCSIRDRATEALRERGYIASVQIPPQQIESGVLRLEVVTARIVEVRLRGDVGRYREVIQGRIDQLKALSPVREQDIERILLLTDDIPGVGVQMTLQSAGTEPGEVIGDLVVTVNRARFIGNVQNYGSRQLGRETIYGRAELYGLTGANDLLYVAGQSTLQPREQKVVQAGYVAGLGSGAATFSLGGTYAWSRPDIGTLDLRARSLIVEAEVTAPLRRSVTSNVYASLGFDLAEQRTRVYSGGIASPLNRDLLRTVYFRLSGTARVPRDDGSDAFFISGNVQARKGLDIFGATKPLVSKDGYTPSRFEGDAQAWVVRGQLEATAAFGPIVAVYGRAEGQWADRPLLNFDEYSLGNLSIGRGYDPGANSGDRAVALRGEVSATFINAPTVFLGQPGRVTASVFGFYDSVWLWNLDTGAVENNRRLGSYGGGLRVRLLPNASIEAIYAKPEQPALLLPGAKPPPGRLLLSLTVQFFPR